MNAKWWMMNTWCILTYSSFIIKSVQKNLSPINFGQIRLEFKHIGTVGHIVSFHFFIKKKWKTYVIYVLHTCKSLQKKQSFSISTYETLIYHIVIIVHIVTSRLCELLWLCGKKYAFICGLAALRLLWFKLYLWLSQTIGLVWLGYFLPDP